MNNSLVAFALVAEEYERSGDPVRGLAPLFRAVLAPSAGKTYDANEFSKAFSERYGLFMPAHVARALAERLSEIGLLKAVGKGNFEVSQGLDELSADFDEARISDTVALFRDWATAEVERLGLSCSSSLEDALLARLARPEFASVFTAQASPRSSDHLKGLLGRTAVSKNVDEKSVLDYLVARFVLHTHAEAPEVFDELSAIAYGALIADAVAGLSVPGIAQMPDPALRVVIDGPLLLDYLNLNTDEHREYAEGLFRLMRSAGLTLVTFDHLVDEVRNTIRAAIREYQAGKEYGPLGARLRTTPGFTTYAAHVADTLEAKLEGEEVGILRFELYERQDLKNFFDDARVDSLRNLLGDVHHNIDRRIRDANSVAGVIRMKRSNRRPASIFQAGTTFLTRNSALYSRVQYALSVRGGEPEPRFAIVTDSQLCGVLWFTLGFDGKAELTKKRLIANCAAAVLPQRDVVQKIAKYLEELDPALADEFTVLMRDQRASLCPMRLTAGQVELVTSDLAREALEEMREELEAPYAERLAAVELAAENERRELLKEVGQGKEAVHTLQGALDDTNSSFNHQLAQLSLMLEAEQARVAQAANAFKARADDLAARSSALRGRASRRERKIVICLHIALLVLMLAIALLGLVASDAWVTWLLIPVALVQLISYGTVFSRVESHLTGIARRWTDEWTKEADRLDGEASQMAAHATNAKSA